MDNIGIIIVLCAGGGAAVRCVAGGGNVPSPEWVYEWVRAAGVRCGGGDGARCLADR